MIKLKLFSLPLIGLAALSGSCVLTSCNKTSTNLKQKAIDEIKSLNNVDFFISVSVLKITDSVPETLTLTKALNETSNAGTVHDLINFLTTSNGFNITRSHFVFAGDLIASVSTTGVLRNYKLAESDQKWNKLADLVKRMKDKLISQEKLTSVSLIDTINTQINTFKADYVAKSIADIIELTEIDSNIITIFNELILQETIPGVTILDGATPLSTLLAYCEKAEVKALNSTKENLFYRFVISYAKLTFSIYLNKDAKKKL